MQKSYPYEKLGLMYLGREIDMDTGDSSALPLLYKNKDLTTHGVIIGMTGSGKTGLGMAIIEEAIMDDVPSIIIDPKGDMGNLLLTFPGCTPEEFLPWIDPAEAARKEMSPEQYAARTADSWREGLASWGQDVERIAALREKTDMTLYTPGSSAGVGVSVLSGFSAPPPELLQDTDTINSLVNTTATSLLALVDIDGDPLQSREHILLSSLFLHFWRQGEDLTMEALVGHIVNPPFDKVGVLGLNTFYPQSQRMGLAMALNNILASPAFKSWTEGVPLDIGRILYSDTGKPQTAIFSIAHLSETERMFFVTMLLNRFVGWMRRQQGAATLKAMIYMDEIFGYFPPTSNPPSKKPMLLLLKQARAYGVGVILATQNPVDLDYKGLSNIGTWFVGRLQTSQDQQRVLDGIVGASDGRLDTTRVRKMLSNMKGRQFLLNSAHLDSPLLFETRWVLSYLKGPISKDDIKRLMDAGQGLSSRLTPVAKSRTATTAPDAGGGEPGLAPLLPGSIEQLYFLQNVVQELPVFQPWLAAEASVRFYNTKRNIDTVNRIQLRLYLSEGFVRPAWEEAEETPYRLDSCMVESPSGGSYYPLPAQISSTRDLRNLGRTFADYLYNSQKLELYRIKGGGLESGPGESLADFKVRVNGYLKEQKTGVIEKIMAGYQADRSRLEQKLGRALDRLDKEKVDVKTKTTDSLISIGVAVVGAFLGRKTFSASSVGRAATGIRSVGRVAKEKSDVLRMEEEVSRIQAEIDKLEQEMESEIVRAGDSFVADDYELETFAIKPRRADIFDVRTVLLWEMVP
jgi:hypothetical protein